MLNWPIYYHSSKFELKPLLHRKTRPVIQKWFYLIPSMCFRWCSNSVDRGNKFLWSEMHAIKIFSATLHSIDWLTGERSSYELDGCRASRCEIVYCSERYPCRVTGMKYSVLFRELPLQGHRLLSVHSGQRTSLSVSPCPSSRYPWQQPSPSCGWEGDQWETATFTNARTKRDE